MRKILDRLFANKKLAFWLPLILATGAYLLFVLFGESPDKNELLILTPILTVFAYFDLHDAAAGTVSIVYRPNGIGANGWTVCQDWMWNNQSAPCLEYV